MKQIKIVNKVTNCPTISWDIIKNYQFNQLKDNSNRDIKKLKNSIVKNGFISPFDCWKSKDDKFYIFDGTGRNLALLELENEGVIIPDLPVLFVEAENIKEAKKYALQRSSKHGEITQSSLIDFVIDFEVDEFEQLKNDELNIIDLNFVNEDKFNEDIDFDKINSNEDREKQFIEQLVTCPHCEGKFNIQV
jgi:hypothetical protein